MIVRRLEEVVGTDAEVRGSDWTSRRLLLAADAMGFSLHDTIVEAGTVTQIWYQHHLEAVYCLEGKATIEELSSGTVHEITPGTLYALDNHDRHVIRAHTRCRAICVFNPPCTGGETHDENGTYPLLTVEEPKVEDTV